MSQSDYSRVAAAIGYLCLKARTWARWPPRWG